METNTPAVEKKHNAASVLGNVRCDLSKIKGRLHFIGIGGIGMSALAHLLLGRGISVSGSDKQGNIIIDELAKLGAKIYIGHDASNADGAAGIAVSTAITQDNPELIAAKSNNIPVWHRSEILAALTENKKAIAISGTHGKTTTTAMIGKVFIDCKTDPGIVIGGILPLLQSNCRAGNGDYFIAEADESDGTHASLHPEIGVITNIEADHLENYPAGMKQILDTMTKFANQSKSVVICSDDQGCLTMLPQITSKIIAYGLRSKAQPAANMQSYYQFEDISDSTTSALRVYKDNQLLGVVNLTVPGIHNQYNALATIAVAMECGLAFKAIADSLSTFGGVERRFQIIGQAKDILIIDDYAHHPTEAIATLKAARQYVSQGKFPAKRIVAVFQPHQPGRLRDFWQEFCQAFIDSDLLLVPDVYIARGKAIAGIDSKTFSQEVNHTNCHHLPGNTASLAEQIKGYLKPHDLVITIGAGDITTVGPALLELLRS